MFRIVALAFLTAVAAASLGMAPTIAQSAQVPLMQPATLHALMASGARMKIVDVRQSEEFNQGHIQGAVLMPLGDLSSTYTALPKTGKLVVYCRSGHRSGQAVQFLLAHGYTNAVSLDGGYTAWTAAGYR